MLICTALGCVGHYGFDLASSVFLNFHVVSRSPAEMSTTICAFMGLRSHSNLFSKSGHRCLKFKNGPKTICINPLLHRNVVYSEIAHTINSHL